MKRRHPRSGGNSLRASGMQFLGGAAAAFLLKEFPAKPDETPYMRPVAVAVLGHVAKRYNPNFGAGVVGGAGVLAYQAYAREQDKTASTTNGLIDESPPINVGRQYQYADGIYAPVN